MDIIWIILAFVMGSLVTLGLHGVCNKSLANAMLKIHAENEALKKTIEEVRDQMESKAKQLAKDILNTTIKILDEKI